MIKQFITDQPVPEASICINKSQLKLYNKQDKYPTYYLDNGQEFQIQLFNPTQDTILAKIQLNGKPISQGGLVLKPGERVFLERYLDVAKKFLFETYEVSNTKQVQQAIQHNGDFKVEFFREDNIVPISTTITTTWPNLGYPDIYLYDSGFNKQPLIDQNYLRCGASMDSLDMGETSYFANIGNTPASQPQFKTSTTLGKQFTSPGVTTRESDQSKSIETGRVEAGSDSNQQITYVNKSFEYAAFHTIEYKLLPTSQKINTTKDLNIARYCHSCGNKRKQEHKFCPACGVKL